MSLYVIEKRIRLNDCLGIVLIGGVDSNQESIEVESVYFEKNQINLDSIGKSKLNEVKRLLEEDAILEILIVTYMDVSESKINEGLLSAKRAVFLKNYLLNQGISHHRIYVEALEFKSFGSVDNSITNEKRGRRADFRFFKD